MSQFRFVVSVDAGTPGVDGAEHLVHLLDTVLPATQASYVASTHVVRGSTGAHTAVAASWDGEARGDDWCARLADAVPDAAVVVAAGDHVAVAGPADLWPGARAAASEHRARRAGRVARFAGRVEVERVATVAEVLDSSLVDEVVALGAAALAPDAVLDLREWVRPTWRDGRAVLVVQPASTGLVPFESRRQIACCADH